jgi:hypothetical protein
VWALILLVAIVLAGVLVSSALAAVKVTKRPGRVSTGDMASVTVSVSPKARCTIGVCPQASRLRMKCVDIYAAFNGTDGSRDPHTSGLTVPDGHPSANGSAVIGKAVAAKGFAPLD